MTRVTTAWRKKETAGSIARAGGVTRIFGIVWVLGVRSVNARSVAQTRDLVLQMQLAALELYDFQVVDRGMLLSLGKLGFEGSVPQLKFRKMRLQGHRWSLLIGQIWA
jgi:hypothetical protein